MDHDLICLEATKINRAFEDPVLLKDDRVLRSLLRSEDKYVPQSFYFSCVQTDIPPFMRKMLADWMAEVCRLFIYYMSDVDWYAMLRVADTNLFFCRLDGDLTFHRQYGVRFLAYGGANIS